MRSLRRRGTRVGGAKVGPDYIDTSYHRIACGRPSYNLDAYLTGGSTGIGASLARSAQGVDLVIIEGVMGLFDGAYEPPKSLSATQRSTGDPRVPFASTAHVALATSLPVALIVDASASSQTLAAIVHGLISFTSTIAIAGVIVNKVASARHEASIIEALRHLDITYFGALPTRENLHINRRHLGLIPASEYHTTADYIIDQVADEITHYLDLDALVASTRPIAITQRDASSPQRRTPHTPARISYATGSAFSFSYQENLDLLAEAGADLQPFDPLEDEELPQSTELCILGGGFPETYLDRLGANRPLLDSIRSFGLQGGRIWAECGGHLLLGRSLQSTPLIGLLPTHAEMTPRLTMGYRNAVATQESLLFEEGESVQAHEFHYSQVTPEGDGFCYLEGEEERRSGYTSQRLQSSFLHLHLGGHPKAIERLVAPQ
jgi:cobyrinic acid a,c-diamide synthase